jgi:hypothetical protein
MLTNAFSFLAVFLFLYSAQSYAQITQIDSLKENNSLGVPIMVNDTISTTGIVTSILQMGTGTSGPGTIQNSITGISVYGSIFTQASGLQVGDSVVISNWKVSNYNGLNELETTTNSNVQIISTGHTVTPAVITIPQISQGWNGFDKYQSMYVQLNNVTFADTASQFRLLSGKSYGISYIVNNSDTVEFYFTKNCSSLLGKPLPKGPATVIGIVQQYESSSPYSSGYEIVPLDSSGVITSLITPIDSLKENNSIGVPIMVNDTVNTTGIVTSITQLGTGTSGPGTIQNSNTGISVYGSVFTQATGLQIGDSVIISNWKVSNYNGLNELETTTNSNVQIISTGHTVSPTVITIPQISQGWNGFNKYQSMYVQLNNVTFADTATQFRLLSGKSYGQSYILNNSDTVEFYFTKNCTSLLGKPMPKTPVSVKGIVQQYDASSPYSSGYEIVPLDSSAIIGGIITPIDSLKENNSTGVPLKLNDTVNTTGIVTSITQLGTGTSGPGTIQNSNTGISVYGSAFTQTPGLQVGDSVIVSNWIVGDYNGLNELETTVNSNIQIISTGHTVTPVVITIPQINQGWNGFNKYQSMLVQINNVTFADTASQFRLISGSTYGRSFIVNNGDTVEFFFTKNCPSLLGKPIPKVPVSVKGIVDQYTSSTPANNGYEFVPLDSSAIITTITAIASNVTKVYTYNLYQNYPNPFNPSTIISFSVPSEQRVELTVYDILGRKIATLFNSVAKAGITSVNFKADNLASGIYIYSIRTNDAEFSKKLMLLK